MRDLADRARIEAALAALGAAAEAGTRVYLTGGATAVLLGWRDSTIDIDIRPVPESERLLRAIPLVKESQRVNVELASPLDFVPVPEGWEERGLFERDFGSLAVYHFDLYAQALSKVERGHAQDVADVEALLGRGLVERAAALAYFERIEPELYRFPAIDPASFRRAVEMLFA
ncbi:MAG TPA: DUF6036 family nucleotidyltransferase [Solirubrobacterales bacterium]|nr:DUF6036 family nucleotidyltransferase [Solirubrobacterales bacterium]